MRSVCDFEQEGMKLIFWQQAHDMKTIYIRYESRQVLKIGTMEN